jgi:hypothetical protein
MHQPHRTLGLAATIAAMLALGAPPAAHAGGMGATLEGPGRDGVTYTVHMFACSSSEMTGVTGAAEGVVQGKRRTLPLTLVAAGAKGDYQFQRTWPRDGHWLVRLAFAGVHAPAMVAELGRDGRVRDRQFLWDSDGRYECETRLAAVVR